MRVPKDQMSFVPISTKTCEVQFGKVLRIKREINVIDPVGHSCAGFFEHAILQCPCEGMFFQEESELFFHEFLSFGTAWPFEVRWRVEEEVWVSFLFFLWARGFHVRRIMSYCFLFIVDGLLIPG